MLTLLIRYAKRIAVFVPGIIIAFVSVKYTLPFFDKHLPAAIAIAITYGLAAYVLIPSIIRLWRIIIPPRHLPLYCVTPDGFASDPINIGIVCTRHQLIEAMDQAGWHMADPHDPKHLVKHIFNIVVGGTYHNAPVSTLYMFGRKQDIAFEIPVEGTSTRRHHVRFWATTFNEGQSISVRSIHWHHRSARVKGDTLLWVGAASLDVGIMLIRHNMQLTHMVHPDTNQERELIVSGLRSEGIISRTEKLKLGNPYKLVNRTWRGELHTDGVMEVIYLNQAMSKFGPSD